MGHLILIQFFTGLSIAFGMLMPGVGLDPVTSGSNPSVIPDSSEDFSLSFKGSHPKQKSLQFRFYGTPVSLSYKKAIVPKFPKTDAESIIAKEIHHLDKAQYK